MYKYIETTYTYACTMYYFKKKKMEDDAVKYADEDRKIRELVDVKNSADGMIH